MRDVGVGTAVAVIVWALGGQAGAFERFSFDWRYKPDLPMSDAFEICTDHAPGASQDLKDKVGALIQAAAAKWDYARFKFVFVAPGCDSNGEFPSPNGVNQIDFGPTEEEAPGVTRAFFKGSQMIECDIRFDANLSWNTTESPPPPDQWDLMTTAMHEFGHCLGLNDENSVKGVVMNSLLGTGDRRAKLMPDDIAGRAEIYGK
ncbi:matrixin family metalloprotease [Mesorhizobium sp. B2-4-9]|uniref:matrixin family metalloprotease n=1 Tax=Mesorhizobium sp. B2-4-9 TaxID=2589940 RepID=UPI0011270E7E|nr:matrixin family metalloprotease [Mesorhizobium sp. B2-4-9]TPL20959.1 matrixin family metalloprotease [Mesorhizobium sp. B2-4-9]